MMKNNTIDIVPQNGYVLCKRLVGSEVESDHFGFVCKTKAIPIYEVLKISNPPSLTEISSDLNLKIGDHIVCSSSGTQIQAGDDEVLWLFKQENIAAKIKN